MLAPESLIGKPELEMADRGNVFSEDSVRGSLRKTEDGSLGWLLNAGIVWNSLSNKELGERIF